jgi:hypothetical protein
VSKEHFNPNDSSYAQMAATGRGAGAYGAICDEGWAVADIRMHTAQTLRKSLRSQLYRGARDLGNIEAAEKGPTSLGKRYVRRAAYRKKPIAG